MYDLTPCSRVMASLAETERDLIAERTPAPGGGEKTGPWRRTPKGIDRFQADCSQEAVAGWPLLSRGSEKFGSDYTDAVPLDAG